MQAMASTGVNDLKLNQSAYPVEFLKGRYHLVESGGKNRLYSSSDLVRDGFELNLNGESWLAQYYVDLISEVFDTFQVNAAHIQIEMEAMHEKKLTPRATIIPH